MDAIPAKKHGSVYVNSVILEENFKTCNLSRYNWSQNCLLILEIIKKNHSRSSTIKVKNKRLIRVTD